MQYFGKRTVVLAAVALGMVLAGARAVGATALAPVKAPLAAASPQASATPGSNWSIAGTIQQMNGQFWVIQGFVIRVTDDTRITGTVPGVGEPAAATGIVEADGTWQATSVQIGTTATATATPISPTATATAPTATPTAVPPTPTATATAVPSPTLTPTAEPVRIVVLREQPPAAGRGDEPDANQGQKGPPAPPAHRNGPPIPPPQHGHRPKVGRGRFRGPGPQQQPEEQPGD